MKAHFEIIMGSVGFTMATVPQVFDALNSGIKVLAGIGGLALLFYSIQHKRILIRKDKKKDA